jgi:hypothetical protein
LSEKSISLSVIVDSCSQLVPDCFFKSLTFIFCEE